MEIKRIKPSVGVIVARVQVPSLTEAHVDLIKTVQREHEKVLLFLGLSAAVGTKNNPLDLEMRRQMIHGYTEPDPEDPKKIHYPFREINILYIKDQPSDEAWSKSLDSQIRDNLTPGQSPLLYGGRDSFIKYYSGRYPTQELIPTSILSGTAMRDAISKKTKNSREFREGVIWAVYNQFPRCFATVDVAFVDEKVGEVILGRKENETKLRFIGGFAEPKSPSYETDAVRELKEETHGEVKEADLEYIGSTFIDDWRYRSECDKIKTIFFYAKYTGGELEADDDIVELRRIKIADLTEEVLVDTHKPLYHLLRRHLMKKTSSHLHPRA